MPTGSKNKRSTTKGIRFPHELIEAINASVALEKANDPDANFSAWVLDACNKKLAASRQGKSTKS
ncbi:MULTISPECIES: YlcI/YnfO family protein [unclassified Symbiopectobacterium]|uniref:YlcI/YnfO family protein n=1 Tax=unclassified Symbiopectobacterium TaxID=2794573 RepID=UPI002226D826|nr:MULTISPECIES: YlcI/YnfO family protein [unclassified Symbiopectobacterium]MCW2475359.1 DUF3950 domain-containing protein [Candidatus Symbiopectobacterium sp. NZEC151]MCW2482525.1 DUF3950 domain-containing protein [Candidatus Symbiopectobacterium sp. NZEC135]MCW2486458.1 DUF3950 domain-containing protein [Candidatus Symbiopectobacterium sp. NZEC127]